jgi:hypothetical protein
MFVIITVGVEAPLTGFALFGFLILVMVVSGLVAGGAAVALEAIALPAAAQAQRPPAGRADLRDRRVAVPAGAVRALRHPAAGSAATAGSTWPCPGS